MLSARARAASSNLERVLEEEAAAAAGAGGGGGACTSLAAPMLVDAAAAALRGWSASEPGELPADASNARASQIAHLLSLLASLTLPDGVLPDPAAVTAAGGGAAGSSVRMAARRGKRAHPAHLAPCLIECIGQPAHLYASGAKAAGSCGAERGRRRLLHLMGAGAAAGGEASERRVRERVQWPCFKNREESARAAALGGRRPRCPSTS